MKILKELTPKNMQCGIGACPAWFKTDRKTYLLIGKKIKNQNAIRGLKNRISKDDAVIEVPLNLLSNK